jgi:hypothetical protein
VTLAACLAAVGAAQNTASAAVPVELILTTVKVALGTAAASSGVTALLAVGLQGPTIYKPKIAAALLILAVSAGLGGTLAMLPGPAPIVAGVPLPDGTPPDNRLAARRTEPQTKPLAIVSPEEERRVRREGILRDQVAPRVAAALQKLSGSVQVTKTWVDKDQTGHLLADWQLANAEQPAKVDIKYYIDRNHLEFRTDLWNGEMRHISFQKPIILFRFGRYEKSIAFAEEADEIYKAFDLLRTQED